MNPKVAVVFLAVLGLTIADDSLLDLTDADFSSRIAGINAAMVLFYDPWCPYCPKGKEEFEKASEALRGTKQPFLLATVNCYENGKETCLKYSIEIENDPIIKIFRMGELSQQYNEAEDAAGIAKFMKTRYGVASTELLTLAETEEFLKAKEPTILAFFEKGNDLETFYFKYAGHFTGDYRFGHSSADEVFSKYNEKNSILLFRAPQFHNKFEPNWATFKGDTQEELTKFIKKNWYGLVGHRKPDNIGDFEHPNVVVYYTIDYVNNAKQTNYWRNRILQVAKDNTDYKFAISSDDDFGLELLRFGQTYLGEEPLVTAYDKDGRKFKMTSAFSVENLKQFVLGVKQGTIEPFIKSQAIPTANDEPVKIAVAKNFDEIVINNGKDTFLEIYAPSCGYCRELKPVFDELGAKMIDEDVEIVKLDGANNEVPVVFQLQGFPSLYWLPKDSKNKPIMYVGGKTLNAFIEYIAEHASSELKNFDRNGNIKKSEL
ncbi:protein disulfide-isomerase A3-like [Bradysia coprophila]|uniref:protein disulfide-isomerase A3-like n=1 Tax=Bradysia coprophila TaxID=38358 RepID=UPI00187D784D|nr:protein disulfide-isomerase A3-like [Bradysia coprophila]